MLRWLKRRGAARRAVALLAALALLAGCGQKPAATAPAASFAAAVGAAPEAPAAAPGAKPADSPSQASPAAAAAPAEAAAQPAPAPQDGAGTAPQAEPAAQASPVKPGMEAAAAESGAAAAVAPKAPAAAPVEPQPKAAAEVPAATAAPAPAEPPAAAPAAAAKPASNELKWSEFFDDDKQTTPSNKFWDFNGKTVQIKGFMGEVLSFDKYWFLLIPKPGAECPFDNGDETYWNKIMIVYVPKDTKLRYTTGPLQITGRLDVGIKIDESGYKTMFRLYDAKFEPIKE
ncbi:hypothetical protein [Paenibacillus rigui]|uniref:Uncharacterized protein n=1 Tax=Paenibacillus rigui TaxID=554312 RepID=A0A229UPL6_9BACL|nr:hypothetical protein [Paenibacillus rigui]OXM85358.1 hypothetical protein CF651_16390 [Paenibacillus rigui]